VSKFVLSKGSEAAAARRSRQAEGVVWWCWGVGAVSTATAVCRGRSAPPCSAPLARHDDGDGKVATASRLKPLLPPARRLYG